MLDEFKVKKPAGFPDHPHRGFETVRELSSILVFEGLIRLLGAYSLYDALHALGVAF